MDNLFREDDAPEEDTERVNEEEQERIEAALFSFKKEKEKLGGWCFSQESLLEILSQEIPSAKDETIISHALGITEDE